MKVVQMERATPHFTYQVMTQAATMTEIVTQDLKMSLRLVLLVVKGLMVAVKFLNLFFV